MRVRELKAMIEDTSDDAVVLVPGSDHSYREVNGYDNTVAFNGYSYAEWAGEENATPDETPEHALVME